MITTFYFKEIRLKVQQENSPRVTSLSVPKCGMKEWFFRPNREPAFGQDIDRDSAKN